MDLKLHQGKFRLDARRNLFMKKKVKLWNSVGVPISGDVDMILWDSAGQVDGWTWGC